MPRRRARAARSRARRPRAAATGRPRRSRRRLGGRPPEAPGPAGASTAAPRGPARPARPRPAGGGRRRGGSCTPGAVRRPACAAGRGRGTGRHPGRRPRPGRSARRPGQRGRPQPASVRSRAARAVGVLRRRPGRAGRCRPGAAGRASSGRPRSRRPARRSRRGYGPSGPTMTGVSPDEHDPADRVAAVVDVGRVQPGLAAVGAGPAAAPARPAGSRCGRPGGPPSNWRRRTPRRPRSVRCSGAPCGPAITRSFQSSVSVGQQRSRHRRRSEVLACGRAGSTSPRQRARRPS